MSAPGSALQRYRLPLAACLLAVIFLQMVFLARANSATWDEADHTYAGYMQWQTGDYGLNPQHPPLIKYLATLPLLSMNLKRPPLLDRPFRLQEVIGGREFVFQNDANAILFRARMAASLLTLLLAVLAFCAAEEMFDTRAGLLALALLAFDPTLLGHSALVTTDAGQACFLLASIYAYYRYIQRPTAVRLILTGIATGLALASKHSAVLLFPMLLLLACIEAVRLRHRRANATRSSSAIRLNPLLALIPITILSIAVLWASYGFHYAARPNGLPLNPSFDALLARVPSHLEAAALLFAAHLHLLPLSYLYGFAEVLINAHAFTSYLLGTIYPHPVWFYFPIAMLIKSTLTFLLLLAIALWAALTHRVPLRREFLYFLIPAAIYMLFAMAGGMNIGVRHVLPVYVFLSIVIAGAGSALIARNPRWAYAFLILLAFQAVSVLHAFPAYVSYANEAFGGPANVHRYLSDSSADWGQQLKSVKRYLDRNRIHHCWFAYFGQGVADPAYYGIPCKPLITADSLYFDVPHDVPPVIDGPVLMSAGVLSGFEFGPGALNPYAQFQSLHPAALIDNGVFVFNGRFSIPLAAALSHTQKATILLNANQPAAALEEAHQAIMLAPDSALVNDTLGEALDANGRPDQARLSYEKAASLARSIEPEFQQARLAALEQRLSHPSP